MPTSVNTYHTTSHPGTRKKLQTNVLHHPFSALTLLTGWMAGHLACNNLAPVPWSPEFLLGKTSRGAGLIWRDLRKINHLTKSRFSCMGQSAGRCTQDQCPPSMVSPYASWHKWYHFISNDEFRCQTNQPLLTEIIQARHLTLFGHIIRMDDNVDACLLCIRRDHRDDCG